MQLPGGSVVRAARRSDRNGQMAANGPGSTRVQTVHAVLTADDCPPLILMRPRAPCKRGNNGPRGQAGDRSVSRRFVGERMWMRLLAGDHACLQLCSLPCWTQNISRIPLREA